MARIPLEDNFDDVINKAQRGLKISDADLAKRAEVSAKILNFYDKAKGNVEARLKKLDEDVDKSFDGGATAAQKAFEDYVDKRMTDYKIKRYLRDPLGPALWIKDQVLHIPDEVNAFYEDGRKLYIEQMDLVLDGVAAIVETGLSAAKAEIAQARGEIAGYVAGLDPALQEVGHKAAADIGKKLDELDQGVNDKQGELIDGLAQKYNDALQKVDDRICEKKAANKGLVDQARDAVAGSIDTIIKLRAMLLGVLARAANAIDLVIKDPIKFLGNLVAAVKLGVQNFASRIGEHLKQGFMDWLFGAVAEAGIQMPKTFDLKGILSLVLQILGLTYANIRARAVGILGEKVVAALETTAAIFKKLITEGPGALWEWIKEKVGDLKAMVIDQIKAFIIQKVIVAGITWIIGLLNPASAFVKACKAIYDIIMFFVERGAQIMALVNAVIDSVTAIAMGQIGGAAKWVESSLAKAIPVVIGFLAGLLGLGGISDKIKSVVETIRKPINAAIDWVIHKAVALVKAAGKFVAGLFGGKEKKADKNPHTDDPVKAAKVEVAILALSRSITAHEKDGKLSHDAAVDLAATVHRGNPIFKTLKVKDGGGRWIFLYTASEESKGAEAPKLAQDLPLMPRLVIVFDFGKYDKKLYQDEITAAQAHIDSMTIGAWIEGDKTLKLRKELTGSIRDPDDSALRKDYRSRSAASAIISMQTKRIFQGQAHFPSPEDSHIAVETGLRRLDVGHVQGDQRIHGDPEALGFTLSGINRSIGGTWGHRAKSIDARVHAYVKSNGLSPNETKMASMKLINIRLWVA